MDRIALFQMTSVFNVSRVRDVCSSYTSGCFLRYG